MEIPSETRSQRELAVLRWIAGRISAETRRRALIVFALAASTRVAGLGAGVVVAIESASWLTWATGLAVFTTVAALARRLVSTSTRVDAEADLHEAVCSDILDADVVDELMVEPHFVLSEGIHTASDLVASGAPGYAAECLSAVFALAALALVLDLGTLAVVLAGGLASAGVMLLIRRRIGELHRRAVEAQEELGSRFAIALHGRLEWVAAGAERKAREDVRAAARAYQGAARRAALGVAILGRAPAVVALVVAAALLVVVRRIDLSEPLSRVIELRPLVVLAAAIPILLGVIFGAPEIVRARKHLAPFADIILRAKRREIAEADRRNEDAVGSGFVASEVHFSYGDERDLVLRGVSFEIDRGIVVFLGPNGSGKSTLMRLLLGLREPTKGTLSLGPTPLPRLRPESLRRAISFVPQRPYLGEPYTSVAESLGMFEGAATREAMTRALDRVGLPAKDSWLERPLGELSVGQRQRVGLARMLLREELVETPVVMLDEPDANLDVDTLARLEEILEELGQRRLVIVAAHGPIAERLRRRGARVVDLDQTRAISNV